MNALSLLSLDSLLETEVDCLYTVRGIAMTHREVRELRMLNGARAYALARSRGGSAIRWFVVLMEYYGLCAAPQIGPDAE